MKRSTWTRIYEIDVHFEYCEAVDLGAYNYGEIDVDSKNYGEVNLDA